MRRNLKHIVATLAILAALCCANAEAALFKVGTDNGAFVQVGESVPLIISIIPDKDEKVMGGSCTLKLDPEALELSSDRNAYAADPALNLVERFKVDPAKGEITFIASSDKPLDSRKIFIRVPVKMKKAGGTSVVFSSAVLYDDKTKVPSNVGYFRLFGNSGEDVDPLLYASLTGENTLLTTGSLKNSYKFNKSGQATRSLSAAASGISAETLKVAEVETDADVIVEFSKRTATIGAGQYVLLDIMITKFPEEYLVKLAGFSAKVKFDPKYLRYVNRMGREVNSLDINRNLDLLDVKQLKRMAKDMDIIFTETNYDGSIKKDEDLTKELREKIRAFQGEIDDTLFSSEIGEEVDASDVDNSKGEINLVMILDYAMWASTADKTDDKTDENSANADSVDMAEDLEPVESLLPKLVFPQKVATLIFRGVGIGKEIPVEMQDVITAEIPNGTQVVRKALITIDPKHEGCDQTLPTALCTGTFKITGNIELKIEKEREFRKENVLSFDEDGNVIYVNGNPKTVPTTFIKEKYSLFQTWNAFLSGSLRNGVRVDGSIRKAPDNEQKVDIELVGNEGYAHLGDFTSTFPGTQQIRKLNSTITGIQMGYDFGNFGFTGLMAEGRSESGTSSITGRGIEGPYTFSANGIIVPGSVQLTYSANNVVIPPSNYTLDEFARTVKFSEILPQGIIVNVSFEISTFVFSTGNLRAFGLGYDSQKGTKKKERFTADTAFSLSMAPQGDSQPVFDVSQTFRSSELKKTYCPDEIPENTIVGSTTVLEDTSTEGSCLRVPLDARYIVEKESLTLKNAAGEVFTQDSKEVYELHRTWLRGYFLVDHTTFSGTFTVDYSYYNTARFDQPRIYATAKFEDLSMTKVSIPRSDWPENVIKGSEIIYLSESDDSQLSDNDAFACFYDNKTDNVDWDELTFCNSQDPDHRGSFSRDWYNLDDTGDNIILTFHQPRNLSGYDNYKYVKIFYRLAPSDTISNSEFTKTAFGLDTKWVASEHLTLETQLAQTKSDLSSAYTSITENILIDAISTYVDEAASGEKCTYSVVDATEMEMSCKLDQKNIKTPVLIKINFCLREGEIPGAEIYDYANLPCREKLNNKGESAGYVMEQQDYYITSDHPAVDVNTSKGIITFKRIRETLPGTSQFKDKYFYDPDNYEDDIQYQPFLTQGDFISVNYLYAALQEELVDGQLLELKGTYKSKWMDLAVTKRDQDPFYDSSFKGKVTGDNSTSLFNTTSTFKLGSRFNVKYNTEKSEQTKLDSKLISSITNTDKDTYGVEYSNPSKKRRLKDLSYIRSITTKKDTGIRTKSTVNTAESVTDIFYNIVMKEGFLSTDGTYKDTRSTDFYNQDANNDKSIQRTFNTKFNPYPNLSLDTTFSRSKSAKGKRSRTNKYTVGYRPFALLSLNLNFDRSTNRSGDLQPSNLTESNQYVAKITRSVFRMSDIQYTITQKRLPRQVGKLRRERSDKREIKFSLKIAKPLILTPIYTRSLDMQTSYILNKTLSWALVYSPTSTRGFRVTWNRNNSNENTAKFTETDALTDFTERTETKNSYIVKVKPTKTSTLTTTYEDFSALTSSYDKLSLTFDLIPTPNTLFKTNLAKTRSLSSPSRDMRFTYTYAYTSKLNFLTSWGQKNAGNSNNKSRTTDYDFTSDYRLNPKTNLYITYKDHVTRSNATGDTGSNNPRFIARLKSDF